MAKNIEALAEVMRHAQIHDWAQKYTEDAQKFREEVGIEELPAAPGQEAQSQPRAERDVQVARVMLDEKTIGTQLRGKDASFPLNNLFRGGSYTKIYFRTENDNIYSLDDHGELIDGNASLLSGQMTPYSLNWKDLEAQTLAVGQPFDYGGMPTPAITEIVAVEQPRFSRLIVDNERLAHLTGGRRNTIIDDFAKKLPISEQHGYGNPYRIRLPRRNR